MITRSKRVVIGALLVLIGVTAACVPEFGTPVGDLRIAVMSVEGSDAYVYTPDATGLTIAAPPGNSGSNTRHVYWDQKSWYRDLEVCQTWDTIPDLSTPEKIQNADGNGWQPGVALRIAPTPGGDQIRAIVVDVNIWGFAPWVIQANLWQTTASGMMQVTTVASPDMSAVIGSFLQGDGTLAAPPWHLCARAVADQLTFKIWTGADPEPAWDDPVHARTLTLPPEAVYSGYAGGYIGHVKPGYAEHISNMRTAIIPLPR